MPLLRLVTVGQLDSYKNVFLMKQREEQWRMEQKEEDKIIHREYMAREFPWEWAVMREATKCKVLCSMYSLSAQNPNQIK